MREFCPGYVRAPYRALVADYPDESVLKVDDHGEARHHRHPNPEVRETVLDGACHARYQRPDRPAVGRPRR